MPLVKKVEEIQADISQRQCQRQAAMDDLFTEDVIKIRKVRDLRTEAYTWINDELEMIARDMDKLSGFLKDNHESPRSNRKRS
jgi:hypothetical protein